MLADEALNKIGSAAEPGKIRVNIILEDVYVKINLFVISVKFVNVCKGIKYILN